MKRMHLRTLQLLELEALVEVDRICRKYNLKYYIDGGTLLGAVRHNGFVHWDGDLDISMMRTEYDEFLRISPHELPDKYFLQNYNTDPGFLPALTRICINGTYLDDRYSRHLKFNKAAYIDIFPVDNVPDDERLLRKHERGLRLIDNLILFKSYIVYNNGPLYIKLIGKKAISILMFPIRLRLLQLIRERIMTQYSDQDTLRVCSTANKHGYRKQVMDREIYGKPVLLEFEGGKYYAPQQWQRYLEQIFDDYTVLPPIEDRKPEFEAYEI